MREVIDVAMNVSAFASEIRQAGARTVIRYYNHQNSQKLPTKQLTRAEAEALDAAGLSLAVVFQQGGGANGNISDLTQEKGTSDAARALELAQEVGQPSGSTIYFAVDHDYVKAGDLQAIEGYFRAARERLGGRYVVGCYGSGTVTGRMKSAGLIEHIWLSGSSGWSGTKDALSSGRWTLHQKDLEKSFGNSFRYDGNVVNPASPSFGQFALQGKALDQPAAPTRAMMEVTAAAGLRLRTGPGTQFDVVAVLPHGSLVEAVRREGEWIAVDREGDGAIDGFLHSSLLRAVSGGLPAPAPVGATPFEIARIELQLDVLEVPGAASNPRIAMYHASTHSGPAPDETPWCSSFVNYCVEQAGLRGTDNKWALSWHDSGWGIDVTTSPQVGDIVVFERRRGSMDGEFLGGHVGFLAADLGATLQVLGGNQSNRVSLANYPRNGALGAHHYRLRSIRRA